MKLVKDDGLWILHLTSNTFVHLENDWRQLFGGYNWSNYRLAHVEYENDSMTGGREFIFVLFGLGIRIRHNDFNHPFWESIDGEPQA